MRARPSAGCASASIRSSSVTMLTQRNPSRASSCTALRSPAPRSWRSRISATPTGCADELERFAHRSAGRDHVVDDQPPPGERRTHDATAFAVVLGLLAVEGERDVAAVRRAQRDGGRGGERDALVRWAEQHVEAETGSVDGGGVAATERRERLAVAEQAGVEEVRTLTAGLEREAPEAQRIAPQCEVDEQELVLLHVI